MEAHVEGLSDALSRAGVEVTILTQSRSEASGDDDLRSFRSWTGDRYRISPGLGRWVRKHRRQFDLLHLHSYHAAAAPIAAGFAGEQPMVLTPHYHGVGHTAFSRVLHRGYRPIGRWMIARADVIIAVSASEAQSIADHHPGAAERIFVVPNAAGSQAIAEAEPHAVDDDVILSVGRLESYKNVERLVSAVAAMAKGQLVVIGDGPERDKLRAMALNTGSRVRVLGQVPRPELDSWLRSASVVATLSSHEAFGMTLLEGLVAGARVVASDIPAHREVVQMFHAGDRVEFLDMPPDPRRVAAALVRALAAGRPTGDPPRRNWDDVAAETLVAYKAALERV
ncbi:MAG: glycosyltransferase family 4 protein [Acidimicrobiales bacterium]|nr:glycosyltransferase family 4 protein [Acidimicrobiales bacterium]